MSKQVYFCHCKSNFLTPEIENELTVTLNKSNLNTIHIYDLCGMCAEKKETVQKLFEDSKPDILIACHTRTFDSLMSYSNINLKSTDIELLNLRELTLGEINAHIEKCSENSNTTGNFSNVKYDSDWPSWYPVIDYNRCVNCGQCVDFCLFGTYSKTNEKVWVSNPHACKNNCPACARICPETAIIFPKYKDGGAIAGSDSIDEQLEQERRLKDTNEILGSDIYKALTDRKRKREQLIKREAQQKAIKEREDALNEINQKNLFNPFGNIKPV